MIPVMRKFLLVAILSLGFTCVAHSEKIPDAAWQTGTLDAMTGEAVDRGAVVSGHTVIPLSGTVTHFTLHGAQFIYHADRGTIPRDKPLHVTIHAKVQFAVVGNSIYLKDEEGKVHKLTFVSKEIPQ